MDLLSGVNHTAVMTADLDRFVEFYAGVFDLDVVFEETNPVFRHAVDDLGAFHSVWFTDPDGMPVELVLIVDDALEGIHAPRPLGAA